MVICVNASVSVSLKTIVTVNSKFLLQRMLSSIDYAINHVVIIDNGSANDLRLGSPREGQKEKEVKFAHFV